MKESEYLDENIDPKFKPKKTPMPEKVGTVYNEDKNAQRTGWTFDKTQIDKLLKEVHELKSYISADSVALKIKMETKKLLDIVDQLRAVVNICYPTYHGLPEWEPCKMMLESNIDLLNIDDNRGDFFKFVNTSLWCAGREYERHKMLCDYVGKNEKTKIICKLTSKGSGAPVREPLVDAETQKKMLQIYFKKQEEQKKLEEDNDDSYMNSVWADPKGLKRTLQTGHSDINWKYK